MTEHKNLALRRAQLTPEQRKQLLQRYRPNHDLMQQQKSSVPRRQRDEQGQLSYAQLRHWFLWQLSPQSTAYHLSGVLRLRGALDREAVKKSFSILFARHESLRTIFRDGENGLPEQIIKPESEFDLMVIDMCDLPVGEHIERAHAEAIRINTTPFDLTQGPLLRVALIQLAPKEHHLVIVMHHIISDAWSNRIIINEFAACYRARVEGQKPQLPELSIQYADYALWQRNWMEAGEKERQLQYWRKQLGEDQPVLQFPADHARSPAGNYRAVHHDFVLPPALAAQLQYQAQERGATLFMTLLAGFQILLYRYTGQNDIRVGVPIANRHRVEIENVVGLFVNTQVLRAQIDGCMPLSVVLEQVRDAALEAQTYQDLPFEQLVEALQPERNLNQNPLFQIMFNHLREDDRVLKQLPGLGIEECELGKQGAQFELTLDTLEKPDGRIEARFTYAAELFEANTIKRLGEHYLRVLDGLSAHLQHCVNDILLLSAAECEQLKQWGVNERRYDNSEPVQRLIERQVELRPNAVALIFGDTELSYAELNTRANRLAHHFITLGVRPESRVGIAVERSVEMIVGLLAILKAGGAYVPLDPDYPRERLNHMVTDSGVELLLTQSHIREQIPHTEGCQILELDKLDLADCSSSNPEVELHRENLAYIIYTSGSTGKPKGVMVRHCALSHLMESMHDFPGISVSDTLISVTALSFDIAGLEIYLPLTAGARIVLAPKAASRDGSMLAQLLKTHQASILQLTPAGWRVLLATEWQGLQKEDQLPLKCLCGGEALQADLVDQLGALNVELWNMYGPTETTIWSTIGRIDRSVIALGVPVAATQLYILDAEMNLVPTGVTGELYLGGVGLARGYLNNPGLTAKHFIANPFDITGSRLYRTGDLARWHLDGQIEYLGRLDYQVKVRGFRIELGEIETQLLLQPDVREAVVVARESPSGMRLAAYVSLHTGSTVEAIELRESIREILPDYMLPASISVLEALPLNASGKVDRKRLPEPEFIGVTVYEAPKSEAEIIVAVIWAEVLGIDQIGRNDNFFELGGHSLAILQVQQKLQLTQSILLPLRELFENPILKSIASLIQNEYLLASRKSSELCEMSELLNLLEN